MNNKRTDGITALMAAAVGGHFKTVKLLVDKGADLHEKDNEGLTALINAAEVRRWPFGGLDQAGVGAEGRKAVRGFQGGGGFRCGCAPTSLRDLCCL